MAQPDKLLQRECIFSGHDLHKISRPIAVLIGAEVAQPSIILQRECAPSSNHNRLPCSDFTRRNSLVSIVPFLYRLVDCLDMMPGMTGMIPGCECGSMMMCWKVTPVFADCTKQTRSCSARGSLVRMPRVVAAGSVVQKGQMESVRYALTAEHSYLQRYY